MSGRVAAKAISLVCFAVVLTGADRVLGGQDFLGISPTLLTGVAMALSALISIHYCGSRIVQNTAEIFVRARTVFIIALIFFVAILASCLSGFRAHAEAELYLVLAMYQFALFCLAVLAAGYLARAQELRMICAASAIILTVSVVAEAISPEIFGSTLRGRASGFPGNPNGTGVALISLLILSLRWDRDDQRWNAVVGTTVVTGILLGMSRAAILVFALVSVQFFRASGRPFVAAARILFMIVAAVFAFGLVMTSEIFSDFISFGSFQDRYDAMLQLSFVRENDIRLGVADEFLDRISERPIVGYGYAYSFTFPEGPHNMYLRLWFDAGLFGIATYCLLLMSVYAHFKSIRFTPGVVLVVAISVYGFFSHNLLEDRFLIVAVAIAFAMSVRSEEGFTLVSSPARRW